MKIGDRTADILVALIAEHREFCGVSPEDRSIGCDPMHGDHAVLEKVGELIFAFLQRLLRLPTLTCLEFKCMGFLLQEDDGAKTLFIGAQGGVSLGRNGAVVFGANLLDDLSVSGLGERTERIGAMQMEGMRLREMVPELLELDGRVGLSFGAKKTDHLTKGDYTAILFSGSCGEVGDDIAHKLREQSLIGTLINHDLRESFDGVQENKTALLYGNGEI